MANPIWKDYYVNLGTSDSIQYRILVDGEVIYSGKAFKRPNQTYNQIRINDICADYLQNVFPTIQQTTFTGANQPLSFTIETLSGESWSTLTSVQFDNNWSYDYDYDPATMGMAFPINGRIDLRQWVVFSAYNAASITATVSMRDGTSFKVVIPVEISDDFNADFNYDFAQSARSAQTGTAVFDLAAWGDVESITLGNKVYKVVTDCRRYALYYVNAYGGWDSLLIEGNYSEVDNLTRHIREVEYDNRSISNRGKENYVNEIVKKITLNTFWLSDEESSRMHHLLNSTSVFLGDINTGDMIPVVLDNITTEYKTYKSNGGRLVNYQIIVSVAQDRIRR